MITPELVFRNIDRLIVVVCAVGCANGVVPIIL
jgi:hypothetical protein